MAPPPLLIATLSTAILKIPRALDHNDELVFTLDVPLSDLGELALRPVRWMLLVAWGLVHREGHFEDASRVELDADMLHSQLAAGEYTFVANKGHGLHLRDHTYARPTQGDSVHESQLSANSSTNDLLLRGGTCSDILKDRDGGICVFSGFHGPTDLHRAHVLPRNFSHNTSALKDLARERNFNIEDHLDPRNTFSIILNLHNKLNASTGFILATDDRFLRNQDVHPPHGVAKPTAKWMARDEPSGQAYIWQSLDRFNEGHVASVLVKRNQRARFATKDSKWYPCPKAINYHYVAVMVARYLRSDEEDVPALLRRSVPPMEPPVRVPSDSHFKLDKTKKRRIDAAFTSHRANDEAHRHRTRSHENRGPVAASDLLPIELMNRLTRDQAFVRQKQLTEKEYTRRRLSNWLKSTPTFEFPDV